MGLFKSKKKLKLKQEIENIGDGKLEADLIKKENKKLLILVGVSLITIVLIMVFSSLINIYNYMSSINVYLGYGSLVLILLLIIVFIVIPIVKVVSCPSFSIDISEESNNKTKIKKRNLKSVAKNLINGKNSIPLEEKEKLGNINNVNELRKELNYCYDKYIKKDINKIIWVTSCKVACSTGISKHNTFDAVTVIINNIRMIMQIVVKCGYRPSYLKLSKLMIKVLKNSLLAYSIESANLGDLLLSFSSKFFSSVPFAKPLASALEGTANGFLTARVGILTKKYLFKDFKYYDDLLTLEETLINDAAKEAKELIENSGE